MARKVQLYSSHKPVPLARILEEEMDRDWTQEEKDNGRVMGRGTEEKIILKVETWGSHDDSSHSLEGTMRAERGGTIIDAKIGRGSKALFFIIFWFGFLSIFLVIGAGTLFLDEDANIASAMFIGIPALMMAIGFFVFRASAKKGPKDQEKILAFLAETVKAREQRRGI